MTIRKRKKKQERTHRQKLRSLYFSGGLILLMIAVCLIFRPKGPGPKDPFETMNGQLDSLVDATYGPGVELDDLSRIETVSERDSLNNRLTNLYRELKIQRDLNKLLGRSTQQEGLAEEIDRINEQILSLGGEGRFIYSRRIYLTLPDGTKMTGFQQSDQNLTRGRLVKMAAIPEGTQALQQFIEKGLEEKNEEQTKRINQ